MDVGGWLRNLGLGQYEGNFRDNKIDEDVLADLTDGDLEKLGLPLGDRKRLLKAIAALVGLQSATRKSEPVHTPARSAAAQTNSAERRPLTVMFCDLVGSTSLAAKLDAEDWFNLVNAYLDEASRAVTGLGGYVLRKLGDGLMALFGYPMAQENDAERAVRAALAIQRALADISAKNSANSEAELSARIGIDSGPVVVEANGEVFGDAPYIAVGVQAVAEPGSVFITMNVQRQVAGLFVAEELGVRDLKDVSEPVELFHVIRASGGGRRGGARTLTPFVGREEELGFLARRWERAKGGEGQLVLIVGEPGLGKSRLIQEFHSQLTETPHTWNEYRASQLLQNTPLHPIAEWGRQRFGVDAPAPERLADLENTLRLIGLDPAEHTPLLAPLVDIPLPPEHAASFPPEELRRRQLAAMTALVLAGARSQPVVLAFEDLHWADPTSLDLLCALADRGGQSPLLILATTRPEFRPPWSLRSHHNLIALSPLDRAAVARMVSEISARHALSKEVIDGVSERTGGVPLFVEEVTRLLLERGDKGVQAIPPTLQQSLAARLDRLGPARDVAQIGAVLGRDFAYPLLRDVVEFEEAALQSSLERLVEADLLFVEGAPPIASYRFKHALIQDAAYESVLKSRRQALHRRAAELLCDDPERSAAQPEVIAHHFTQAGLDDHAIEWWGKAGDQALRRSAFQEAIAHLGKAIEMAEAQALLAAPDEADAARRERRVELQTAYGQALMYSKGYAAEETRAAFARVVELAGRDETSIARRQTRHAQWARSLMGGEIASARSLAESLLREAEAEGHAAAYAHRALGLTCLYQGKLALARSHLERALSDDAPEPDMDACRLFGIDFKTTATAYLALSVLALGDAEHARRLIDHAVREGGKSGHVATIANTTVHKVLLESFRDDPAATLSASELVVEFAREHNMAAYAAAGELFLLWARGRLLDPEARASQLRQALAAFVEQGNRLFAPSVHGLIAELEAISGRADIALASVDAGLALAEKTGERWTDPLLIRRKGEILFHRDPTNPAPAEEAFRTAIEIAKQQGSRSFGLRTVLSLAKLYRSTGRPADAHAVLTPALEGLAPNAEMPEIEEAAALLAALTERDKAKPSSAF
jgi:class 3 adenylate cyclase/predicted ATPase